MVAWIDIHNSHLWVYSFNVLSSSNYYTLQNMLEKGNPFRLDKCDREQCFPCMGEKGGRCDKKGSGYNITCEEVICQTKHVKYDGESARPAYTRGREHLQGYRAKGEKNPLWKHASEDHQGRLDVNYKMTILKCFGRSNLARKVNEAIRITNNKGVKLNSKAEFRQPSVPRAVIHRGRNGE
jgi:hypothetical protein